MPVLQLDTDDSALVRTDRSDDIAWARLLLRLRTPANHWGFLPEVEIVDDPVWQDATPGDLERARTPTPESEYVGVVAVADRIALGSDDFPLLLLSPIDGCARFRCVVDELWQPTSNLFIANTDWADYADDLDADGVFGR